MLDTRFRGRRELGVAVMALSLFMATATAGESASILALKARAGAIT
jgi:predicted transglutaminase-like cysteine proteinase